MCPGHQGHPARRTHRPHRAAYGTHRTPRRTPGTTGHPAACPADRRRTGVRPRAGPLRGGRASACEIRWLIPYFHGPGYDPLAHIDGDGSLTGHIPAVTALRTLLWVLLPAGGLPALRSPLLLVALPTLGRRFISHYPEKWGTAWHYSAVLMLVAFLALVDALAGPAPGVSMPGGRFPARTRVFAQPVRVFAGPVRAFAAAAPAAAAGAALALCAQLPVAGLTHRAAYQVNARTRAVDRMLDRIPDGATVESDIGPLSRLVRRTTVYWIGDTAGAAPQYIALTDGSGWLPDPVGAARRLYSGARYAVLARGGGGLVLRRL